MRSLLDSKKGQLGSLQLIITTLMIVGILLGVAFLVLEEFKDNLDNEVGTVTNEVVTVGDVQSPGRISSAIYNTNCFSSFATKNSTSIRLQVTNATSGAVIPASNYTYSSNGTIWYIGAYDKIGANGTGWNVTYTYNYGKDGCGGIVSTITATTTITTWLTIIVILVIVGILLAIVFSVLPSSGGGSSGGGFRGRGSSGSTAEI